MKVVHYTKPFFKLHPITIKNADGKAGILIKPQGGLWCSPLDSEYGWIDWCREKSYGDIAQKQRVILDIDTANFVVIDSEEDVKTKLPWYQFDIGLFFTNTGLDVGGTAGHEMFQSINFEKMVKEGVDGIHLTEKGESDTRFSYPWTLYGWDCETILILNERCIKEVSV